MLYYDVHLTITYILVIHLALHPSAFYLLYLQQVWVYMKEHAFLQTK